MRLPRPVLGALALLAVVAAGALADSWRPFGRQRTSDANGEYYVVIDGSYSDGSFVYARRAEGATRVEAERDRNNSDAHKAGRLRPGDAVLARGQLRQLPLHVHVSSRGNGFVCIEKYGNVGYGKSVVIVSPKGEIHHELKLSDLFDTATIETFQASVSSIWWHDASWIDEESEAVVLSSGKLLRVVSMKNGSVRNGTHDDVRKAIDHDDPAVVNSAIDIAAKLGVKGLDSVYGALVLDASRPLGARLRAGATFGTPSDVVKDLFRDAAERPLRNGVTKEDRAFALERLGDVLGEDALPILRDAMRGEAGDGWHNAQTGLARMGTAAVPTLIAILGDEGTSDYRGGAAHVLRKMAPGVARPALDALLDTISDPAKYVANAAANAAISIDNEGIAGRLAEILAKGSTQDGRIANYFEGVRHEHAIPALEKALPRHNKDSYVAGRIHEALAFQRGR